MALKYGEINYLLVKRETDISYTLTDGEKEVFLHFNQSPYQLEVGQKVPVFLYFDQKKRLCATLETPRITANTAGFVKVVKVLPEVGVFLNIGIAKDILLSKDYMGHIKSWPIVDDEVLAIIKVKSDQLVARLVNKEDHLKPLNPLEIGSTANAVVTRIMDEGIGLYTSDYNYIFLHRSLYRENYRLGQRIDVKIINQNTRGEYLGTVIERKEFARLADADTIIKRLKSNGGVLPLGNSSTPEEILNLIGLTKSAFKRAVGNLYKEKLIQIEDKRIILIDED